MRRSAPLALAALLLLLVPGPAWASTYVLVPPATLTVVGVPFTPLSGHSIKTDFPPDMNWIDVTALATPPLAGSSYNPTTGVFTAPPPQPSDPAATAPQTVAAAIAAVQASVTSLAAQIPTPSTGVPLAATATGIAGSGLAYLPANAAPPSLTRAVNATTASDGTLTVTWTTPLVSSAPTVILTPMNTASQPAICNQTAVSANSVSARCWLLATQVVSVLGATVNVASGSAAGMKVSVFAREPTP